MSQFRVLADGTKIIVKVPPKTLPADYRALNAAVRYGKIRNDFIDGARVPDGVIIEYMGRTYHPGESLKAEEAAANAPSAQAQDRKGQAAPQAGPESTAQTAQGPKAPYAAPAPTLDMFESTDPNAARTAEQNNAFWGLLDKLAALTGKTPNEMKVLLVQRALGENKGTSKLTVKEMDQVIDYVKRTLALFGAQKKEA